MKLDIIVKAARNGTFEMLENFEGFDGATRVKLRAVLDELYAHVTAFQKENDKVVKANTPAGSNGVKTDNPRYAYVINLINEMLDQDVKYQEKAVISRALYDSMPLSVNKERSLMALGLVAKE